MWFLLTPAAFAISATVGPGDDINAVLNSLGPGDVITFNDGLYELENTLRANEAMGEEGDPVRFVAANGAAPVLKMTGNGTVFELRDSSWVVVEGLTFEGRDEWEEEGGGGVSIHNTSNLVFQDNTIQNMRNDLLRITGDTTNLLIADNHLQFTSNGTALYVGCGDGSCWMSDSVITHNLIHDAGNPDSNRSGLVLDNGCQANEVSDNVVFNVTGVGLRVESTQLGESNTVRGNAIWATGSHGLEITGDALVQNNVVFETDGHGIRAANHENDDVQNVRISFNTIALTGSAGVRLDDWADKTGMVFSSNVVANINGRGFVYDSDDFETTENYITGNIVSGLVEGVDETLHPDWYVPGAGVADFEDVANWDFYPAPTSTLLDAGDSASEAWVPTVDFNGQSRNGEAPTVGAFQWSGRGNPGWIIAEGFKDPESGSRIGGGVDGGGGGGCCGGDGDGGQAMLLLPLVGLFLRRRRQDP
jgi:hypothetical protein